MAQQLLKGAGLIAAGGGMTAGVAGLTYLYLTAGKEDQLETEKRLRGEKISFVAAPDRKEKFEEIAAKYDYLVNTDERFMGMNVLRRQLLYWHAKGTCLELACGTGRNISFYPSTVDRVVMTDSSDQMLQQARRKVAELDANAWFPKERPKFAIFQADVDSGVLDFPDNSFETIVDTFGLCSFDDPVAVLKEMERVCKPGGKILLLEHGRSKSWNGITQYLDKTAERHAKNWGCVHNRDLDAIIERSGLQLDRLITWHFGTTYYMVCRPIKSTGTGKSEEGKQY